MFQCLRFVIYLFLYLSWLLNIDLHAVFNIPLLIDLNHIKFSFLSSFRFSLIFIKAKCEINPLPRSWNVSRIGSIFSGRKNINLTNLKHVINIFCLFWFFCCKRNRNKQKCINNDSLNLTLSTHVVLSSVSPDEQRSSECC